MRFKAICRAQKFSPASLIENGRFCYNYELRFCCCCNAVNFSFYYIFSFSLFQRNYSLFSVYVSYIDLARNYVNQLVRRFVLVEYLFFSRANVDDDEVITFADFWQNSCDGRYWSRQFALSFFFFIITSVYLVAGLFDMIFIAS